MITNFFYRWSSFDIKFVLGYMPFFTINIPRNQTLNEAENTELLGLQKVLSRVFNVSKSFQRKYLWKQFSFERASVAKMASQNTKDDPDFRYAFLWSNTLCPFFFFFLDNTVFWKWNSYLGVPSWIMKVFTSSWGKGTRECLPLQTLPLNHVGNQPFLVKRKAGWCGAKEGRLLLLPEVFL